MEAQHLAEVGKRVFTKASLVRLGLPGGDVHLTDGGFVVYAGDTYLGRDPTYDVLSEIGSITDGESQAQRLEITIQPSSDAAVAALSSPLAQGSRIDWWECAIDHDTGEIIGDPELKFMGEIDFARLSVGSTWSLVIECGTQAERFLEPNDDRRLTYQQHEAVFPAELGLRFVTDNPIRINWRNGASNAISYGGGTGGGGKTTSGGGVVTSAS